jgi:hypothetical protein
VLARQEIDIDLTVIESATIRRIQHLGDVALASRQRRQDRAHEPSLARARGPLKDEYGRGRLEISFDEGPDAAVDRRIRRVEEVRVGHFVEGYARQTVRAGEMPIDSEHFLAHAANFAIGGSAIRVRLRSQPRSNKRSALPLRIASRRSAGSASTRARIPFMSPIENG